MGEEAAKRARALLAAGPGTAAPGPRLCRHIRCPPWNGSVLFFLQSDVRPSSGSRIVWELSAHSVNLLVERACTPVTVPPPCEMVAITAEDAWEDYIRPIVPCVHSGVTPTAVESHYARRRRGSPAMRTSRGLCPKTEPIACSMLATNAQTQASSNPTRTAPQKGAPRHHSSTGSGAGQGGLPHAPLCAWPATSRSSEVDNEEAAVAAVAPLEGC